MLSVSGLETNMKNSRNIPRLKLITKDFFLHQSLQLVL